MKRRIVSLVVCFALVFCSIFSVPTLANAFTALNGTSNGAGGSFAYDDWLQDFSSGAPTLAKSIKHTNGAAPFLSVTNTNNTTLGFSDYALRYVKTEAQSQGATNLNSETMLDRIAVGYSFANDNPWRYTPKYLAGRSGSLTNNIKIKFSYRVISGSVNLTVGTNSGSDARNCSSWNSKYFGYNTNLLSYDGTDNWRTYSREFTLNELPGSNDCLTFIFNGTGEIYIDNVYVTSGATIANEATTLAFYELNNVGDVTTFDTGVIKGTPGEPLNIPDLVDKNGITVKGWYTDAALTQKFTGTTYGTAGTTTKLYAKWSDDPKITFVTNGGSAIEAISGASGSPITMPANPIRSGFDFGGWYTDSACTLEFTDTVFPTTSITLYAKWKEIVAEGNWGTQATQSFETYNTYISEKFNANDWPFTEKSSTGDTTLEKLSNDYLNVVKASDVSSSLNGQTGDYVLYFNNTASANKSLAAIINPGKEWNSDRMALNHANLLSAGGMLKVSFRYKVLSGSADVKLFVTNTYWNAHLL